MADTRFLTSDPSTHETPRVDPYDFELGARGGFWEPDDTGSTDRDYLNFLKEQVAMEQPASQTSSATGGKIEGNAIGSLPDAGTLLGGIAKLISMIPENIIKSTQQASRPDATPEEIFRGVEALIRRYRPDLLEGELMPPPDITTPDPNQLSLFPN